MATMTREQLDKLTADTLAETTRLSVTLSSMQRRIDALQGNNQGGNTETPMNAGIKVDRKAGTIREV